MVSRLMVKNNRRRWQALASCCGLAAAAFALALTGCASRPAPPAPVALSSPLTGSVSNGTIVAIRPADPAPGNLAMTTVLRVLGQTAPVGAPGPAEELIIRRPDRTITSILERPEPGQPGFTRGEAVTIVEAAATVVRPD